jgi:superfamily II DNA/RNA helicase
MLAEQFDDVGIRALALHGDLDQARRTRNLERLTSGRVGVLVATDVAARGIDVDGVTHVVNYQCPEDEKTYVHRIGRTGRAGHSGVAVSFIDWDDIPRWKLINSALGLDFEDPAETYSSSPHLRADLDIADDATGTLPTAERTRAGLAAEKIEDLGETGRGHGTKRRTRGPSPRRSERGQSSGEHAAPTATRPQTPGSVSSLDGAAEQSRATAKPRRRRRRTRGGAAAGPSAAQAS